MWGLFDMSELALIVRQAHLAPDSLTAHTFMLASFVQGLGTCSVGDLARFS